MVINISLFFVIFLLWFLKNKFVCYLLYFDFCKVDVPFKVSLAFLDFLICFWNFINSLHLFQLHKIVWEGGGWERWVIKFLNSNWLKHMYGICFNSMHNFLHFRWYNQNTDTHTDKQTVEYMSKKNSITIVSSIIDKRR